MIINHPYVFIIEAASFIQTDPSSPSVFPPDDHSRVKLKTEVNTNKQDYINASTIVRNYSNDHIKNLQYLMVFTW